MICSKCGAKNPKGENFCASCGCSLLAPVTAPVAPIPTPDKNKKIVVIVLLAIVCVSALIIFLLFQGQRPAGFQIWTQWTNNEYLESTLDPTNDQQIFTTVTGWIDNKGYYSDTIHRIGERASYLSGSKADDYGYKSLLLCTNAELGEGLGLNLECKVDIYSSGKLQASSNPHSAFSTKMSYRSPSGAVYNNLDCVGDVIFFSSAYRLSNLRLDYECKDPAGGNPAKGSVSIDLTYVD